MNGDKSLINVKLVKFVTETDFSHLPKKLIAYTKLCILDTTGYAIAGSRPKNSRFIPVDIMTWGGCREATIIGRQAKASALDAFHDNIYAGDSSEFDRSSYLGSMHPGRSVIHAALAIGEKLNASYMDVITATILVYEIILRVGHALRPIGWPLHEPYPNSVLGSYCFSLPGVTNIAARLIGIDIQRLATSEGNITTATNNEQRQEPFIEPEKSIPTDNKVRSILSGILTFLQQKPDSNVTINEELIDDITTQLSNSATLTQRLGNKYLTAEVGLRPTLLCHFIKPYIWAAKKAIGTGFVDINKIQQINVTGPQWLRAVKSKYVQHASCRMAAAMALLANGLDPEPSWYVNGEFENPIVKTIAQKVRFFEDIEGWFDWSSSLIYPVSVLIKTTDIFPRTASVKYKVKEIDNVVTKKRFITCFSDNTVDILGEKRAQELQKILLSGEDTKISELMKLTRRKNRWIL